MARIECSECSEMVDVTASSVVLPYVCSICDENDAAYLDNDGFGDYDDCNCGNCEGCESRVNAEDISMEEVLGTGQKYEDMAPAVLCPTRDETEELIADLKAQNERLTEEIEFADKRATRYMWIAKLEEVLRVSAEAQLTALRNTYTPGLVDSLKSSNAQFQKDVLEYQEKVDKFSDERDVLLSKWTILSQAFAKAANID